LVKGYPLEVPVQVVRAMGQAKLAVQVTGATSETRPGAFTFKPAAPATTNEVRLTLSAGPAAPEGKINLVVLGKARVGPVEQTVAAPALALTVRRAFELRLASANVDLLPGQTVVLRGTVERQPMFKEPVRLTLTGLPPGVAPVKPLAPVSGTAFSIELKVAPKLPAGMAKLTLTGAATIAGQNHVHPPLVVSATVKK
jgi:hypothetical protein